VDIGAHAFGCDGGFFRHGHVRCADAKHDNLATAFGQRRDIPCQRAGNAIVDGIREHLPHGGRLFCADAGGEGVLAGM
jgi:hypothetical protein